MSDDEKVPLPRGAKAGWFTARDGLLYTKTQMHDYGDARERAARAAEREACAKVCDEHYEFLVDVARKHEEGSPSRDRLFSAARAVDRVRQELRARADGGDRG